MIRKLQQSLLADYSDNYELDLLGKDKEILKKIKIKRTATLKIPISNSGLTKRVCEYYTIIYTDDQGKDHDVISFSRNYIIVPTLDGKLEKLPLYQDNTSETSKLANDPESRFREILDCLGYTQNFIINDPGEQSMKYKLGKEKEIFGKKMYQIVAVKDFRDVKAGDCGGYIESEKNLSQDGLCWVYPDAIVCDHAIVTGNAVVCDSATVKDFATVQDNAVISGMARVEQNARISENAHISGQAVVEGYALVYGRSTVKDKAMIRKNAHIYGNAHISEQSTISGNALVFGNAHISGQAFVSGSSIIYGNAKIMNNSKILESATIRGNSIVKDMSLISGCSIIEDDAMICGNSRIEGNSVISKHKGV